MNILKNSVHLFGHAGKDAELTILDNDKQVARVSLATNESYKNAKGEKVTNTQWHNLVAWGKKAENLHQLIKKGSQFGVSGRLTYRAYEDKEGVKRTVTEIVVNEFVLINSNAKPVKEVVEATGAAGMKDMGKVMGQVNAKVAGRADGGTVASLVKAFLMK